MQQWCFSDRWVSCLTDRLLGAQWDLRCMIWSHCHVVASASPPWILWRMISQSAHTSCLGLMNFISRISAPHTWRNETSFLPLSTTDHTLFYVIGSMFGEGYRFQMALYLCLFWASNMGRRKAMFFISNLDKKHFYWTDSFET